MANDAFKRHKRFHLLEKAQFSQEKVQTCENHQTRRADFWEKNPHFFGAPPALKRTHRGCMRGVSPLALGFPLPSPQHLYGFCVGVDCTNLCVWVEANAHAQLHPNCVLCVSMQCLQTWYLSVTINCAY